MVQELLIGLYGNYDFPLEVAMPCVHGSSYVIQAEVTQRLSIAKEAATRSTTVQSHEDVTSTPLSQFLSR
jgi:hypothetical protein